MDDTILSKIIKLVNHEDDQLIGNAQQNVDNIFWNSPWNKECK
jgi:hypothetical protein